MDHVLIQFPLTSGKNDPGRSWKATLAIQDPSQRAIRCRSLPLQLAKLTSANEIGEWPSFWANKNKSPGPGVEDFQRISKSLENQTPKAIRANEFTATFHSSTAQHLVRGSDHPWHQNPAVARRRRTSGCPLGNRSVSVNPTARCFGAKKKVTHDSDQGPTLSTYNPSCSGVEHGP